jgi:hypothetical protein
MSRTLDRRIIYLFVLVGLSLPLLFGFRVPPAEMKAAGKLFEIVEALPQEPGQAALVAFDFSPNLQAENGSQAEVVFEHLMRRRIPVVLMSLVLQSEPFLTSIPEKVAAQLAREYPGERWEYGKDWVNVGYRPGPPVVTLQSISKSKELADYFVKDSRGNRLRDLPIFQNIQTLKNISLFAHISGIQGLLETYLAFLKTNEYRPKFAHGCTSISIPDAYLFLRSGQLDGLLEGIAGAAWYSKLLTTKYATRETDRVGVLNTALGVAHLVIILLIIGGNVSGLRRRRATA